MTKPQDPRAEQIELTLLAADAAEAGRLLLAPNADPLGNVICFPVVGLVAEEALTYFAERRRATRIGSLDGKLQNEFRGALKKVRARLKLLDDTDRGHEELTAFMALARAKSRVLFGHPSSALLQLISGPFRPDLGAFFVGDHLVGTSHAALSTMGVTTELLHAAEPGTFKPFGDFVKEFATALGAHLATLARILSPLGLTLDLRRRPLSDPVSVTHLDFVGERFYRRAEAVIGLRDAGDIGVVVMCVSLVNACLHVLPRLLPERSDVLFRVQFLTAFHVSTSLRRVLPSPPRWLAFDPGAALDSKVLRNLLAHYGLREASRFAIGASEPLMAVVEGVSGFSADDVRSSVLRRLRSISELFSVGIRKKDLKPYRALLGCHT